jgi:hypothetical protein
MKIRWQNSTVLNIPASVQEGWRVGRMSLSPGKRFSLVTDGDDRGSAKYRREVLKATGRKKKASSLGVALCCLARKPQQGM